MSKVKCLYVAGPMTGIAQFNFPLFDAVSEALRADGWAIVSPAETDHEQTRAAAMESADGKITDGVVGVESWGDCLARDVKMLADGYVPRLTEAQLIALEEDDADLPAAPVPIDGIALLPGWENSKGARLEAFVGLLTGKEFYTVETVWRKHQQDGYGLTVQSAEWVQHMLAKQWADAIQMHKPL